METRFAKFVRDFPGRLAMPLDVYSGLEITGESVEDMVSVPGSQFKSVMALHDRYRTPVLLTAVDPTAEAEAYGCEVRLSAREAPSVVGRLVASAADVAALGDPVPGDARTRVPLETAWRLTAEVGESVPVLGAMLGPFALASRLFGSKEAVAAASDEPETIESLLDNVTGFLCRYALEFRETGAWGVFVAEAAAGGLSPEGLRRFSTPFLKRIVKAVQTSDFAVIVHNCQAGEGHLDGILESGAETYHFGPRLDIAGALARVGPRREPRHRGRLPDRDASSRRRGDSRASRGHTDVRELLHLVRLQPCPGVAARQPERLLSGGRGIQQDALLGPSRAPPAKARPRGAAPGPNPSAGLRTGSRAGL
jgi:uroporphyrinogen decarboxylase